MPWKCDTCSKGFARRNDLTRHSSIHSGVKPYKCSNSKCGKSFSRRNHLTRHAETHCGTGLIPQRNEAPSKIDASFEKSSEVMSPASPDDPDGTGKKQLHPLTPLPLAPDAQIIDCSNMTDSQPITIPLSKANATVILPNGATLYHIESGFPVASSVAVTASDSSAAPASGRSPSEVVTVHQAPSHVSQDAMESSGTVTYSLTTHPSLTTPHSTSAIQVSGGTIYLPWLNQLNS